MKIIRKTIPDFKNSEGLWVATTQHRIGDNLLIQTTTSNILFYNMTARCNPNGRYCKKYPTYTTCTSDFKSFQDFAEWCNSSVGYGMEDANGRPWCLDKDLLFYENKVYSADTCCFIPEYVNNSLIARGNDRGLYPLGVSKASGRSKRYLSRCQTFSGRKHLGNFLDPLDAHKAWQLAKIDHLREVAERYINEPVNREDVYRAILCRADRIEYDLVNGMVTDRI